MNTETEPIDNSELPKSAINEKEEGEYVMQKFNTYDKVSVHKFDARIDNPCTYQGKSHFRGRSRSSSRQRHLPRRGRSSRSPRKSRKDETHHSQKDEKS
jgi:hypothetical protein